MDGNDAAAVYEAAGKAIENARAGKGPFFLECKTYRKTGHSADDQQAYRPESEKEQWQEMDPITRLKEKLREDNTAAENDLLLIEEMVKSEVADAVAFAQDSPFPNPADALEHVYCTHQGGGRA